MGDDDKSVEKKLAQPHATHVRDGVRQVVAICLDHAARDGSPDLKRHLRTLFHLLHRLGAGADKQVASAVASTAACDGILRVSALAPDALSAREALDVLLAAATCSDISVAAWTAIVRAVLQLQQRTLDGGHSPRPAREPLPKATQRNPLRALLAARPHSWRLLLGEVEDALLSPTPEPVLDREPDSAEAPAVRTASFASFFAQRLRIWAPALAFMLLGRSSIGGTASTAGGDCSTRPPNDSCRRATLASLLRVIRATLTPRPAPLSGVGAPTAQPAQTEQEQEQCALLRHSACLMQALAAALPVLHTHSCSIACTMSEEASTDVRFTVDTFVLDAIDLMWNMLQELCDAIVQAGADAELRGLRGAEEDAQGDANNCWLNVGRTLAAEVLRLALLAAHVATTESAAAPSMAPPLRLLQQLVEGDPAFVATPFCIMALAALLRSSGGISTIAYAETRTERQCTFFVIAKLLEIFEDEGRRSTVEVPLSTLALLGPALALCMAGDTIGADTRCGDGLPRAAQLLRRLRCILELGDADTSAEGRTKCDAALHVTRAELLLGCSTAVGGGTGATASLCSAALSSDPEFDFFALVSAISAPGPDSPLLHKRREMYTVNRGQHSERDDITVLTGLAAAGSRAIETHYDAPRWHEHADDDGWQLDLCSNEDDEFQNKSRVAFANLPWLCARRQRRQATRLRLQRWLGDTPQLSGQHHSATASPVAQECTCNTLGVAVGALLMLPCSRSAIAAGLPSALARLQPLRALHNGMATILATRAMSSSKHMAGTAAEPTKMTTHTRLRELYELPRLATHASAQQTTRCVIRALRGAAASAESDTTTEATETKPVQPSHSAMMEALALRLRCRLWLTSRRGFSQLADAIDSVPIVEGRGSANGKALHAFASALELRLAAAACSAEVCIASPVRGVAMVKMLQSDAQIHAPDGACIDTHSQAAAVVSLALTSLTALVADDELDFFAAFSILISPPPPPGSSHDTASVPPRVAYFDPHWMSPLESTSSCGEGDRQADEVARTTVAVAVLRFIAAGAGQIGVWAEDVLIGVSASNSDEEDPAASAAAAGTLSSDGLRISTEGSWQGGSWKGVGLSAGMTSSPGVAAGAANGTLSGPKGSALRRAATLLWRFALARPTPGTDSARPQYADAIRTEALRALATLPLGAIGLLPIPLGGADADDCASDIESGVERVMYLLEREGTRRAQSSRGAIHSVVGGNKSDNFSRALIALIVRAVSAEVTQRGKWARLPHNNNPKIPASQVDENYTEVVSGVASLDFEATKIEAAKLWQQADEAFAAGDHAAADAAYAESLMLSQKAAADGISSPKLMPSKLEQAVLSGGDHGNAPAADDGEGVDWGRILLLLNLPTGCAFGAILAQLRTDFTVLASGEAHAENAWRVCTILQSLALLPPGSLPALLGGLLRSSAEALLDCGCCQDSNARQSFYCSAAQLATSHAKTIPELRFLCVSLISPCAMLGSEAALDTPFWAWSAMMHFLPELLVTAPASEALEAFEAVERTILNSDIVTQCCSQSLCTSDASTQQMRLLQLRLLWAVDRAAATSSACTETEQNAGLGANATQNVWRSVCARLLSSTTNGTFAPALQSACAVRDEWAADADAVNFDWLNPCDGVDDCTDGAGGKHARLLLEGLAGLSRHVAIAELSFDGLLAPAKAQVSSAGDLRRQWFSVFLACRMCSAGAGPEGGLQPRLLDACRGWVVRSSSSGLPSLAAPLVAAVVTSLHAADAGGDCSGFSVWVLNVLDGLQFSIRSESEEASHATVLMPLLLISLIALEAAAPDLGLVLSLRADHYAGNKIPITSSAHALALKAVHGSRAAAAFALLPETLPRMLAAVCPQSVQQVAARLLRILELASSTSATIRELLSELRPLLEATALSLLQVMVLRGESGNAEAAAEQLCESLCHLVASDIIAGTNGSTH